MKTFKYYGFAASDSIWPRVFVFAVRRVRGPLDNMFTVQYKYYARYSHSTVNLATLTSCLTTYAISNDFDQPGTMWIFSTKP